MILDLWLSLWKHHWLSNRNRRCYFNRVALGNASRINSLWIFTWRKGRRMNHLGDGVEWLLSLILRHNRLLHSWLQLNHHGLHLLNPRLLHPRLHLHHHWLHLSLSRLHLLHQGLHLYHSRLHQCHSRLHWCLARLLLHLKHSRRLHERHCRLNLSHRRLNCKLRRLNLSKSRLKHYSWRWLLSKIVLRDIVSSGLIRTIQSH